MELLTHGLQDQQIPLHGHDSMAKVMGITNYNRYGGFNKTRKRNNKRRKSRRMKSRRRK
jgi:hypothetical protein